MLCSAASASVIINTTFGVARDADGTPVTDGTLWILVVDANLDHQLPGLAPLGNSVVSLTAQSAATVFATGQSFAVGQNLGADTIFAMGGFNVNDTQFPGVMTDTLVNLNLGVNGVTVGANYAFYFFPGSTYGGGSIGLVGLEAGGIANAPADFLGDLGGGMVIPADGSFIGGGAFSSDIDGVDGHVMPQQFTAVVIPEPSTAMAGVLAAAAGLASRRRR